DDEDSDGNDTNDFTELKETKLVWKEDNQFEKIKRGIYMKGKTSKSTYYDKYGPNGTFTKAAAGVKKITNFFKVKSNAQDKAQDLESEITKSDLSDSDDKIDCHTYQINERIQFLKEQLEKQHNKMTVIEYNQKRAIFEYLVRLDSNGCGKMYASLEAAKIVFVDSGP
ncbi:6880_t:CDS:1, partial [Funneliformis geosporum]